MVQVDPVFEVLFAGEGAQRLACGRIVTAVDPPAVVTQGFHHRLQIARNDAARSGGGPNMVALIEEVRALRDEVAELKAAQTPAKGGK